MHAITENYVGREIIIINNIKLKSTLEVMHRQIQNVQILKIILTKEILLKTVIIGNVRPIVFKRSVAMLVISLEKKVGN